MDGPSRSIPATRPMLAVALALLASFTFGLTTVLVHRAVRGTDAFTGLVLDLFFNSLLLWLFLLWFYDLGALWARANLIFVGAGLLVPGLFRLLAFKGIERLGASASAVILNTSPLFAILMAILFLGEEPGPMNVLGAVCVVGGLVMLSWQGRSHSWSIHDLMFPVGAALLAALRDNLVRVGLLAGPAPIIGATIAATTSAIAMGLFYFPRLGGVRLRLAQTGSLWSFCLVGCIHFIAYITMFTALGMAEVSVVSPLIHCFSLFTLGLSFLFLKDSDPLTPRKIVAGLLVVTGVLLISLTRT